MMDLADKFQQKDNVLSLSLLAARLVTDMDGMTILKIESNFVNQNEKSQTESTKMKTIPNFKGQKCNLV